MRTSFALWASTILAGAHNLYHSCVRGGVYVSKIGFYDTRAWRKMKREVLKHDHFECQYCKNRGRHTRAEVVHHEFHLKDYPQYGLMMWVEDPETGERRRNLVSVCRRCHETVCHPERSRKMIVKKPLTPERW